MTVKSRKKDGPSKGMSDILIIKTNLTIFSSSSWILDSSLNVHLCTSMQDLEEMKRLKKGEITFWISNGVRIAVVAVETYPL